MAPRSTDPALAHHADAQAQLLLACARLELEPAGHERILRLVERGVDWPRFVAMAEGNAVLPLVYRHLDALPDGTLPRQVLIELWGRHETTARRNRARTRELLQILRLFQANAIPAIPYKGPALAAAIYGDVALREFGDLDILLRPRDILRAKALLLARGYRSSYALGSVVEAAFLRASGQYHLVLIHAEHGMVELHWKTDPDFPIERPDDERWWAGLGSSALGEARVPCFSAEEQLLVLCLHGSKHHWDCLGWLVDVAESLRQQPRLDWPWILGTAARLGCERRLMLGLQLAGQLLDAPLPQEVRSGLDARNDLAPLAARIVARIFTPEAEALPPVQALRFNLALYDRLGHRVRHCIYTLWEPSLVEWRRWPLPRALFFVYPALRLTRLAGKHLLPGSPAGATPRTPPPPPRSTG